AVKAMVAGPNYEEAPFNLATQGYRQPGSSIKPFILTTALRQGISPYTVYASAPQTFCFGEKKKEYFPVSNYGDSYLGSADIVTATQYSDNSVYSQIGLANQLPCGDAPPENGVRGGTHAIARTIHELGVRDEISTNPAMVLGGLDPGVTPLQWTYAFTSLANDGVRVSGNLASVPGDSPVAYTKVTEDGHQLPGNDGDNDSIRTRVVPAPVAQEAKAILHNVVTGGTGVQANVGDPEQWGKTGTTENNGDAWFCGSAPSLDVTACVWVGHADTNTPMTTEYGGAPVDGGTFPALIWAGVMSAWEQIRADRGAERSSDSSGAGSSTYVPPSTSAPAPAAPSTSAPAPSTSSPAPAPSSPAPAAPAPAAPAPAAPAPAAPSGGSSGGSSGGAAPG
ncbi:MAG: penicillin-binding transpeptidase domain-containing protein, partial [Solirubrobacterales bacterium]